MSGKCKRVGNALGVTAFLIFLCGAVNDGCIFQRYHLKAMEMGTVMQEQGDTEMADVTQMTEETPGITDLTEAFDVILNGATKEFLAEYTVDEAFLMWLDVQYGDETVLALAAEILDGNADAQLWYTYTGNTIHVLWLAYCQSTGFQAYQLENVYWMETANPAETVISFAGDFNFAENWCTTEYMKEQPGGIYDCFSLDLMHAMQSADILLLNNEFTYTNTNNAVAGKDYTFRAKPEMTEMLSVFGADIVSLANNHAYDYGKEGLLDTMYYISELGIPYVGAGKNIDEASKIVYFVANGRKIAIVSATEIERSIKYTKEATETEAGVLKTLNPEKFLERIELAKKNSDYVFAVVHWGSEGTLRSDASQKMLAGKIVQAGADAIIGGHPHRLQGVDYVKGVPVAYSLGNFWFSDAALYTTLAQVHIKEDGTLTLRYLPCLQKNLRTRLLTDEDEKTKFYQYLASISSNIGIDKDGNIYDQSAETYPAEEIAYDSQSSTTEIIGARDNEGNAIDIVGNLK